MGETVSPFEAGGPVMWALLAACLAMWFLMARRWLELSRAGPTPPGLADDVARAYRRSGAAACVERLAAERGHAARLLRRLFDCGPGALSRARLDELAAEEAMNLSGPHEYVTVLVRIAPLLGLLGTVLGMMDAFAVLYAAGNSDPRALSRGISEALVCTEAGLMVALPGIFGDWWLRRKERRIEAEMEEARRAVSRALER